MHTVPQRVILSALIALSLVIGGALRSSGASQQVAIGASISNPEEITGPWEAQTSPARTVGFSIGVIATVNGPVTTLRGARQSVRFIRLITYARAIDRQQRTWWQSEIPGNFELHNNRLRFHQERNGSSLFDVDLDLVFDPVKHQWSGSFKIPDFSGQVVLKRPDYISSPSSPIGTWRSGSTANGQFTCIHVGMGVDGQLVLWTDYIALPGFYHFANGLHAPARTDETYGYLLDDPRLRSGGLRWMFDFTNGMWGEFITGRLSEDRSTFSGESTYYGNGYSDGKAHAFDWERVTSGSCAI